MHLNHPQTILLLWFMESERENVLLFCNYQNDIFSATALHRYYSNVKGSEELHFTQGKKYFLLLHDIFL